MDIDKCHLCKLDNNHYARPTDNFDLILRSITTSFVADVDVTVFAARDQNNPESLFQEYNNRTAVNMATQHVSLETNGILPFPSSFKKARHGGA